MKDFSKVIAFPRQYMDEDDLLLCNQNWGLAFKLKKEVLDLIIKIKKSDLKVIDFFPEISQGLIAYDKYRGQSEEVISSRAYHYTKKSKKSLKPWLRGEDVTRYLVRWNGQEYIDYCDGIANPRQPKFFNGDRILIREITNPSVYAAFTNEELYNDPSIIIVLSGKKIPIKALLAILNSSVATFYHFNSSPKATKGAFPKILVSDVKEFPLPDFLGNKVLYEKLSFLAEKQIIAANTERVLLQVDKKIDDMVFNLYGLTEEEKKIVRNN